MRGSVVKRGDVWRVRVSVGIDPVTGKRLWLCGTRASQREAEKLRTKLLGQVDEKKASRTRASLGALLDEWLPGAELSATTRDNYAGLIDRFIRPALGALPLTKLTPHGIERFYGELRRCRARCDGRPFVEHRRAGEHDCAQAQCRPHQCRPLAASSVLVLHAILSGALEAASRWEWVSVNPARAARRPKPPPPHPDPPTPEQAGRLVTAAWAQDETWGTLVWLVMTTGMRRIALDPDTTTVLAEHRDRAWQRAALLGVAAIDEWYLFSNDPAHSQPLHPDWVTHRYTAMAAEAGITTHLHALRHYTATELLAADVDLATVSGRLGHGGGGATTLRVYAAWVAASDQRAAEVLAGKMPKRPRPDTADQH